MNKTLLLILLDFLLLHMIHDSPWNKVEKENAHLSGGTDTYARHAEELQFVRLQMQAKDKETEMLADQLAFSRKSEADKARDFAQAQAEIKEKEDELNRAGGALSETERQRLIALKDAAERQEIINLKQQNLNTIKDQMAERDKAIITLTNKVERLNTNIGDLKNEIGGRKSRLWAKISRLPTHRSLFSGIRQKTCFSHDRNFRPRNWRLRI
jgi:chromosome segregation ATPase